MADDDWKTKTCETCDCCNEWGHCHLGPAVYGRKEYPLAEEGHGPASRWKKACAQWRQKGKSR